MVGAETRLWGVISRGSYIIDTVGSGRTEGKVYRGSIRGLGAGGEFRGEKLKTKNLRQNLKTLRRLRLYVSNYKYEKRIKKICILLQKKGNK